MRHPVRSSLSSSTWWERVGGVERCEPPEPRSPGGSPTNATMLCMVPGRCPRDPRYPRSAYPSLEVRSLVTAGRSWSVLCLCCIGLLLGLWPPPAAAEDDNPERTAARLITPQTEAAIGRGLAWLAKRQHQDGSFGSGAYRGNVAVTALCGLALMSGGSTPGRGPYGAEVARSVDYLLAHTQQSGFITGPGASHGPMYGHGFAALFLAECYGMSKRPELREKLISAVGLIVNTQNKDGGWRYWPQRADADISVTICEVMALRAARNAGLFVPNETIDRCINYVKKSQNADGGFSYMIQGGESAFARSAAGVVALNSAGIYEGAEITKGIQYLSQFCPKQGVVRRESYYYYGHYYAVQAMWQAGGQHWRLWYPAVRDELTQWPGEYCQRKDGSWMSPYSPEYATAMALIVLQMPDNCLPIFQR
jgi:hypothetical protein